MAMSNPPEMVAQEMAAIQEALDVVTAAAKEYAQVSLANIGKTGISESGEVTDCKRSLHLKTQRLLQTVRGPVDMIFSHPENVAHTGSLRALLEMGVFDAIPPDGTPITADVLAEKLKVDKGLLVRFMRNGTAIGPFAELGPENYAHTPYSLAYLAPPLRAIFAFMVDDFATPQIKIGEFFKEKGWKDTVTELDNPYTHVNGIKGTSLWANISQFPDRLANLNNAMIAQTSATMWTVGIYPFNAKLSQIQTDDDTVLLVDIGGGMGQAVRQIKEMCSGIRGRMILQDRKEVTSTIAEKMPGIEVMEYDFFSPQPIKGALIYYIRRCLHDWPFPDCVKILRNIGAAMTPGVSCLLISEIVLPLTAADPEAGWMDLTMMCAGGMERTVKQWEELLDAAGFTLSRAYQVPGTNYGAVEASLK